MSVNVAMLRVQIADVPRWFPAQSDPPDTIGVSDGANLIYGIRLPNFTVSSFTLYFGTVPSTGPGSPAYVAQATNTYVITGTQINLNTAPAAGTIIGTRYMATAFADADLANYLASSLALQSDDRTVLKQAQFDLIDVIVADVEKMMILKQGDFIRDPSKWVDSYLKLKEALRKDITGDPRPGKSIPAFATGNFNYNRFGIGGGEVQQ
jgi:hypothetical protein